MIGHPTTETGVWARAQMVDLVTAVNSLTYLVLGSGIGFAILIAVLQVASYKVDWFRRRVNFQVRGGLVRHWRVCVSRLSLYPSLKKI